MKQKIFYLFLMSLIYNYSYSQSTNDLDAKNGYKSYKLGTPKSILLQTLRLEKNADGKYLVLNNPDKTVFDLNVQELWLDFDDADKLVSIFFKIKIGEKAGKVGLLGPYLSPLFGEATSGGMLNQSDAYEMWTGNNVVLMVVYDYIGLKENWQSTILITKKEYYKKKYNNEF